MKTTILAALFANLSTLTFAQTLPSTFHQTCSNYSFVYLGANAGISATCLKADGSPNKTTITIDGISNEDGILTNSGGASSFQKSCGSIEIKPAGETAVVLYAYCRRANGQSLSTSIEIGGITNANGVLSK